eukprot:CAMPEP_0206522646 /NCGR_PEP_ID=MMETSP0324_2-20121206/67103_1 /ASSEMBLY_ACC=CAM_ASM_000836 /TAXON_ID=2866 /ORGANISM="Crypthecodinium cohnii, Strain Seligo" /LENGTH=109 /DNA_ID=CAMNT_0054016843 /DNA_START=240 /DNA_END=567 /DNA_ORIENTATION=+
MATEEAPPQQPEDGSEGLQEDPNASDAHASEPPVPVDVLHVAELGADDEQLDAEHAAERFRYVKADLTKIEECRRVVGSALEVFPNAKCISLLVNNAGISNHVRGGTAS